MNDYQKECTLYNHQVNRNSQQKGGSNFLLAPGTLQGDNLVIQSSQQCPHFIYGIFCSF